MALTKAHNRMIEGAAVNVKDFGAVGDGATDDTAAFTSAASAAGVKAVYVPAGSYKITGSVTSGSFFTLGSVTIVGGTVNVLDVSKPKTPKAHHSLSVLNAEGAALSRYALTRNAGSSSGQNVMQGFAVDPYKGELYTTHITGTETLVVNKFEADGKRTQTAYRWNSTPSTSVGHQQLSISWDKSGQRWFWTSTNNNTANSIRSITRFQIADGAGTELDFSNFEQFQVWDDTLTGQASSTAACSLDGRYLITEYNSSTTTTIRVFDLPAMMEGGCWGLLKQFPL